MPGSVIGIKLNNGWEGTVSRTADTIIQNRIAKTTMPFGVAVKLNDDNTYSIVATGDTADKVAGITVREVVQANTFDPQSNPDYVANAPCDVLTRGNCVVKCRRGTPKAGGAVYVRITDNSSVYAGTIVGGFEADADSDKTIQVTNIEWTTGVMDANGIAEVTVKTRAKG